MKLIMPSQDQHSQNDTVDSEEDVSGFITEESISVNTTNIDIYPIFSLLCLSLLVLVPNNITYFTTSNGELHF